MSKFFTVSGVVVALMVMLYAAITHALEEPTVYLDAASKKCVAVETPETVKRCEELPPRYGIVLVEPGMTYERFMRRFK